MSTIVTLTSGESGANSLIDINANYAALNAGKAEVSGQVFTGAISATNFSGTSSGANTGDQVNITGNSATVTTNANLTGPITSIGNATSVTALAITNAMLAGSIDLTTKVTGILPVVNGGTGSSTQNFVDLTTAQSIGGFKTFTGGINVSGQVTSINQSSNFAVNIANGTSTGTVDIGGTATQILNFGADNTAGITKTVTIGGQQSASTTNIRSGTGGTTLFSNGGTFTLSNTTGNTTITTSTGATTSVLNLTNSVDTINTFIGSATPQGVISSSVGDIAIDGTNGLAYSKGQGAGNTGWELVPSIQYFRLNATGTAITTVAGNFFGTTSGIGLVANAYYKIEMTLYFLKTTAGTVTFNLVNSAAPTSQNIHVELSPATGITAPPGTFNGINGDFYNSVLAIQGFTTASLTTAVNHYANFTIYLRNGTGTSLNLQALCSAGTLTPGIGSFWECTRLPDISVGTLV